MLWLGSGDNGKAAGSRRIAEGRGFAVRRLSDRCGPRNDRVRADRLDDVLQLLMPFVDKGRADTASNHALHGLGHDDAAGLGEPFQACSDVHAITVDRAVALLDHIAEMHSNT